MQVFVLTGGAGATLAFLLGLAFARSAFSLLLLACAGLFVCMTYHATAAPNELLHASVNANLLGWLTGTVLAARLRALEWLDGLDAELDRLDLQEAT